MSLHYLTMEMRFVCKAPNDTDVAFDAFTDSVQEALIDLEGVVPGIVDPDITAQLTSRTMSVLMGVKAESLQDALDLFSAVVRTALHTARCNTADWPVFKLDGSMPTARRVDFAGA